MSFPFTNVGDLARPPLGRYSLRERGRSAADTSAKAVARDPGGYRKTVPVPGYFYVKNDFMADYAVEKKDFMADYVVEKNAFLADSYLYRQLV